MEGINWFDLILCVFIAIVIENIYRKEKKMAIDARPEK
jgi:hypothetical protein